MYFSRIISQKLCKSLGQRESRNVKVNKSDIRIIFEMVAL